MILRDEFSNRRSRGLELEDIKLHKIASCFTRANSIKVLGQEAERYGSLMVLGLEEDHIQSKEERVTKKQKLRVFFT